MSGLRAEIVETLTLGWPLVGAQLCTLGMVFVDNLMVGRLGPDPLAAMSMAVSLVGTAQVFSIGMLSPLSALISQEIGAQRPHTVGRTLHRGLMLAMVLAVLMIGVCLASGPLLRALGQSEQLIPMARGFLLAIAWGMPAFLGYMALRGLAEGVSDTRPAVAIAACAAVVNGILDYGLVYGRLGMPRLELVGAGVATAICQWGMFAAMLAYVRFSPRYAQYHVDRGEADDGHSIWEILRLGIPFSGSLLAEVGFFVGSALVMGRIGVLEQASHQIAINACSFLFMIPLGFSLALSVRVSRARGAGDTAGVRHAAQAGMVIGVAVQLLSGAVFLFMPQMVAELYTDDPRLIELASSLLRIAAVFQIFDGIQVVTMGLLRGMLDTRVPFIATVVSYWCIGTPCALALAFPLGLGPQGLWWGLVIGLFMAALLLQLRLWRLLATR